MKRSFLYLVQPGRLLLEAESGEQQVASVCDVSSAGIQTRAAAELGPAVASQR